MPRERLEAGKAFDIPTVPSLTNDAAHVLSRRSTMSQRPLGRGHVVCDSAAEKHSANGGRATMSLM